MAKESSASSPLSDRETAICHRAREVRVILRLAQPEFAETLRISRERLASYEFARAPIRYEFGKELCYRFGINQRWLATGDAPKAHYFDVDPNLEYQIRARELFSDAYDRVLRPEMEQRFSELKRLLGPDAVKSGVFEDAVLDNFHKIGQPPLDASSFYTLKSVALYGQILPESLRGRFMQELIELRRLFHAKHRAEIEKLKKDRDMEKAESEKSTLTSFPPKSNSTAVSPDFEKLLNRLHAVAQAPGMKGELAAFLGVARSRVSEWLAGKKIPGGETTLRLLQWAEKEEAKQKRPRSVSTTAKAKAQHGRSNEKPNTSDPPKR